MIHLVFHVHSIDIHEGTIHTPTISLHSWRVPIVLILLRWFAGGQPVLLRPSPHTCDDSSMQDHPHKPQAPEHEREHGILIKQTMPEKGSVSPPSCVTPWSSSFADVACIQWHGFFYYFISNCFAIPLIKTTVD